MTGDVCVCIHVFPGSAYVCVCVCVYACAFVNLQIVGLAKYQDSFKT